MCANILVVETKFHTVATPHFVWQVVSNILDKQFPRGYPMHMPGTYLLCLDVCMFSTHKKHASSHNFLPSKKSAINSLVQGRHMGAKFTCTDVRSTQHRAVAMPSFRPSITLTCLLCKARSFHFIAMDGVCLIVGFWVIDLPS